MTDERWQQIDRLLQAVMQCPAPERESLLAQECAGDTNLREAVESLLSLQECAEDFLERPALEEAAALLCDSQNALATGKMIGSYKIEGWLGSGGMGEVYLAEDTKLDRKVAIKFLPEYLEEDELAKERLLREAKAAARLDHPNICAVHEVKEEQNLTFIVMQYVAGGTLDQRINSQSLRLREAVDICVQIVEALAEAHSSGIIHRDIKPGNIMLTARGRVKVLDFGLAKVVGTATDVDVDVRPESLLSRPGDRPGTPPYMSPEQAKGETIDSRSDLFAAGVILYECVAGKRPFSGKTEWEILEQITNFDPPPLSKLKPNLPPELDSIIRKALAKEPSARYQTAADLLVDLKALHVPDASVVATLARAIRKPPVYFSATGVVVVLVVLAYFTGLPRLYAAPYRASPEALRWYDQGTKALHNGAYYEASKALQQAVAADEKFALAHARLAEALTELDYSDQAKDEIIRAEALARELRFEEVDALYLRAVTSTVLREFAPAIQNYQQIANQASDQEKVNVYLDLGRAYENNDQLADAKTAYQQASNFAPQSAATFLRLGVVCGKLQDFGSAVYAFTKAEALYQTQSREGVAEVFYERGFLFLDQGKAALARQQLEIAVQMAESSGNQYQLIKAMQALSSAFAFEGKLLEAEAQAAQAIQLALNNGIENQATSGSIRLGDALLLRGDYDEAERHYQEALQLAQRFKMRLSEAWARRQLGGLRSRQHKTGEALSYIEPAAAFFQQHGYRKWYSQTLTLLGRTYRDNGDYAAALQAFENLHQLGEQLGDQSQVALSDIDLGNLLANEEDYTKALRYFDESYQLFKSLKSEIYLGYASESRASVLWQIGRVDEAKAAIAEATLIAHRPEGTSEPLLIDIYLVDALLELSAGNFRESESKSRELLDLASNKYPDATVVAKQTLGLSHVRSGASRVGARLCNEALELAKSTSNPQLLASALLAAAEANLANGEAAGALEAALRAQQNFARLGRPDSEWRSWFFAAAASERLNNKAAAREYALRASKQLAGLDDKWGSEAFGRYLERSDIRELAQQFDHLLGP